MTLARVGDLFGLVAHLTDFLHYFVTALGTSGDFSYTSRLGSFLDSYIYEIARGRIFIITHMQEQGVALHMSRCV